MLVEWREAIAPELKPAAASQCWCELVNTFRIVIYLSSPEGISSQNIKTNRHQEPPIKGLTPDNSGRETEIALQKLHPECGPGENPAGTFFGNKDLHNWLIIFADYLG